MTGHVAGCPIDEINRPRGGDAVRPGVADPAAGRADRPPVRRLAGRTGHLPEVRPGRRNYTAARLMAGVGLRVNEACRLDLADIKWDLGHFGKLHVRPGRAPAAPAPANGWSR